MKVVVRVKFKTLELTKFKPFVGSKGIINFEKYRSLSPNLINNTDRGKNIANNFFIR